MVCDKRQKKQMKCPRCGSDLRKIEVSIEGAKQKAKSWQCEDCDYFIFEQASSHRVLKEHNATTLTLRQKIIKLSQDRLGMYINKDVARSLNLRGGEEISVSVPDKNHILIELE